MAKSQSVREALQLRPGTVNLAGYDTAATTLAPSKKSKEKTGLTAEFDLAGLQERLFAERARSLLIVLQGIDTAGKGGVVSHVVGLLGPEGVTTTAFKQPTPEEQAHHFLWRIRKRLPAPGLIGVFDRSHYEDVLVVRVHNLVPKAVWSRRYSTINRFEAGVVTAGTTVVKVMLHISRQEQRTRLAERLDNPAKYWKYNPGDIDERGFWAAYQQAYQEALTRCSSDVAPWYIVPADKKWYARWAVQQLMVDALEDIDPQWPAADFDVQAEKARLAAT
jgi:PPK2 family polyphosphate:nucleotide phosphotransferase